VKILHFGGKSEAFKRLLLGLQCTGRKKIGNKAGPCKRKSRSGFGFHLRDINWFVEA
jgi:hypothetical protein